MNMNGQVKRSMKVLRRSDREDVIPQQVLANAQGIVFMTQVKGAYLFSGTLGAGIFMKRLGPERWSPPASIGMASVGAGLQFGAQKVDVVIVLNDRGAVKAFESHGQIKLGGDYAVSAGPVGRSIKAELALSGKGFSGAFSYSMSQGLFVGVSLEGQVLVTRSRDNRSFYKNKEAKLSKILSGNLEVPAEKDKKRNVAALHRVINNLANGRSFEDGLGEVHSALDVTDLDDLEGSTQAPAAPPPVGYNNRDFDDLVVQQRKSRPAPAPGQAAALAAATETATPSGATNVMRANSGKQLLVGALDATGGEQDGTADILGLESMKNMAIAAPIATPVGASMAQTAANASAPALPQVQQPLPPLAPAAPFVTHEPEQPLQYGSRHVVASRDHVVDEDSPDMQAHGIFTVRRGDPCFLIDGTLEFGLPVPYADYVTVQRLSDGRYGKVSRYCLTYGDQQ